MGAGLAPILNDTPAPAAAPGFMDIGGGAQSGPSRVVDVTFDQAAAWPVEVVLPLRLIIYNRNVRRTLITGEAKQLARPLAEWLAKESVLRGKVEVRQESE